VNRQVDVQTGTIKVQGVFPNPESILRPGLYAKIRSPADTAIGAILVPPTAVIETQGQYQVAVVGPDNKVTIRPVTLGKMAGDLRIISAGLSPGERVVTEGVQKVSDGALVAPRLATPESVPAKAASAAAVAPPSAAAIPAVGAQR
jgi:membrane fusion protein (multidrug efflux system)